MRKIERYMLRADAGDQVIRMPHRAELLEVGNQFGFPCVWAIVETDAALEDRCIRICEAGADIGDASLVEFIGSFQNEVVGVALHVFDLGEPTDESGTAALVDVSYDDLED